MEENDDMTHDMIAVIIDHLKAYLGSLSLNLEFIFKTS